MGRLSLIAAALAALAVAVAGCGGSNKQQASYVAAANSICSQELARLHSMPEPTTPAQAITFLPRAIAIVHQETGRLQALGVPASKRAQLASALVNVQALATLLHRFLAQLRAGTVELSSFEQVQSESTALRSQINSHFRQAGLSACVDKQA